MSTRDDVLASLREAGGLPISGEKLARSLGVSRAAVSKHVAALRAAGFDIHAAPGLGYALLGESDALDPRVVRSHVRSPWWIDIRGGGEVVSTMDEAARLARGGAPAGTVVLASRQTGGRGRLGRQWESPEGGVYLSAILRPQLSPAEITPLPLVISLGVARGLAEFGAAPTLKWPNDVMLDDGKVAGILLEMSAEADRVSWVVVGVGLNVFASAPLAPGAAYIADVVPDVTRPHVAAEVLDAIADVVDRFERSGFAALRDEYESLLAALGREVTLTDVDGHLQAVGTARGVDEAGRLVVATATGDAAFASGDTSLRPPSVPI